jgi:head-tail adaptor
VRGTSTGGARVTGLLSAAELASIRADVEAAALSLPCQIQHKTLVRDAYGQATETWSTVATVNAGMTEPSGTHLQNYAYLIEALAAWLVRLPVGTDVTAQDHLIINGETLVVQVVLAPRSYQTLLSVIATELKP